MCLTHYGVTLGRRAARGTSPGAEAGAVDGNTLYPLLRRLEKQGLLTSEWNTDEARPRKFYRTSPAGAELRAHLMTQWRSLNSAVEALNGDNS